MPYTTASTDLPSNVKKLDAKKKAQWVSVWNSSYQKCQDDGGDDCEGVAFKTANGVIKKQEESMKLKEAYQNLSEVTKEVIDALAKLNLAIAALSDAETPAEDEEPETETTEDETPESEPATDEVEAASESFTESMSGVIAIQESDDSSNRRDPLDIEMRLIRAGPGNPQDNHYYPGEMLRKYAEVFEGTKMCTVQHGNPSEKVEVAKIEKIIRFEEDGSPIARVGIFDPDFAEKTRNRAKKKMLDSLECSILASGTSQEAEIDGHKYNVVESIEKGGRVDFVYRAGAGGKALAIAESEAGVGKETETPEQEPILEKDKVLEVLRETNLPAPTQARLTKTEYKDETELAEAITEAIAEVKAVSGSGQPLGTASTEQAAQTRTAEQIQEDDKNWYEKLREGYSLAPRI